jgi:hypothetical protein
MDDTQLGDPGQGWKAPSINPVRALAEPALAAPALAAPALAEPALAEPALAALSLPRPSLALAEPAQDARPKASANKPSVFNAIDAVNRFFT